MTRLPSRLSTLTGGPSAPDQRHAVLYIVGLFVCWGPRASKDVSKDAGVLCWRETVGHPSLFLVFSPSLPYTVDVREDHGLGSVFHLLLRLLSEPGEPGYQAVPGR
jgi:hypothetical protein